MLEFLRGGLATSCIVVALYFLRAWRVSRDRFFVIFALAFLVFAVHWTVLALLKASTEMQHYFYITRLGVFSMIALAIADKNRRM